ncbi:MAG: 30S ribosomal protein S5 [Planctomycetota bacterium]|jgi:small subunit ribosomal protein S5
MAKRDEESGVIEEVIGIYYHTKVTKGGRNLTYAALVAVGDGRGKVGLGYGKAKAVPGAIEKASKEARGKMKEISMVGDTIAHEVIGRHGAARVMLRPASRGTGVKAGGSVRSVLKAAGVHNVLSKVHGNTNPINVAKATVSALRELRSVGEVERLRGVNVRLFHPQAEREPGAAEVPEAAETAQ